MKIRKVLTNLDAVLATFALAMLWGNITLQIILRQVFNRPLMGADELTMFLVAAVIITPLGFLEKEKGHIAMEELLKILPSVVKKVLGFLISVSCTVIYFLLFMSVYNVIRNNPHIVTAMLRMPIWLFFLPCVIGFCGILVVRIITHICFLFKKELPWA
jgi:TRAP-type C4-dicarboxylate transport system permease small subunit